MNDNALTIGSLVIEKASDRKPRPPFVCVYGSEGIGKSTFAARFPHPLVLDLEDGLTGIAVDRVRITGYEPLVEALRSIHADPRGYQTLAVDTYDGMHGLIERELCRRNGWESIEDAGYGKGYVAAGEIERRLITGLKALRDRHGIAIVVLAHAAIRATNDPQFEQFDRHELRVHRHAASALVEAVDLVGFAHFKTRTAKQDTGFRKSRVRALGDGERRLLVEGRPWAIAKNRFGLTGDIEFSAAALLAAITPKGD